MEIITSDYEVKTKIKAIPITGSGGYKVVRCYGCHIF
jgi:hypothetical protein